jgi:hypothetical protein
MDIELKEKKFIPYKLDKTNCKIIQLREKRFNNFNTIIQQIEEKIKEQIKKNALTSQQKNNLARNNIKIGIDFDAKQKIKIKGYKGDKLIDFYNKIIEKLQEFIDTVNEKVVENIGFNQYITEEKNDNNLKKALIIIRNKIQPNCSDDKYKTSGLFTKAFSEQLNSYTTYEILKQMDKDLETCMTFLITIVKEYCTLTAIINKDTQTMVKIDDNLLFMVDKKYSEEQEKEQRLISNSQKGGKNTNKKYTKKQKSKKLKLNTKLKKQTKTLKY